MSINKVSTISKQDLSVNYKCSNWTQNPGDRILELIALKNPAASLLMKDVNIPISKWEECYEGSRQSIRKAQAIFQHFVSKTIPETKTLLTHLINQHQISEMHLPMTLSRIFCLYLSEIVEHYQAQLEERDRVVDQQVQMVKLLFSKKYNAMTCAEDNHEIHLLFTTIKTQLKSVNTLSPHFDQTIDLWEKILSKQFVGRIALVAFFDQTLKTHNQICLMQTHALLSNSFVPL